MEQIGPPVLKNQPTQIFDNGFHNYSQNSLYTHNVLLIYVVLIPLIYILNGAGSSSENQLNSWLHCSSTGFQSRSFNRKIF